MALNSVVVPCSSVPQIYIVLYPRNLQYLVYASALKTQPISVPRCGKLLQYGSALVTKIFLLPSSGVFGFSVRFKCTSLSKYLMSFLGYKN